MVCPGCHGRFIISLFCFPDVDLWPKIGKVEIAIFYGSSTVVHWFYGRCFFLNNWKGSESLWRMFFSFLVAKNPPIFQPLTGQVVFPQRPSGGRDHRNSLVADIPDAESYPSVVRYIVEI
jgi:hypothetical protein